MIRRKTRLICHSQLSASTAQILEMLDQYVSCPTAFDIGHCGNGKMRSARMRSERPCAVMILFRVRVQQPAPMSRMDYRLSRTAKNTFYTYCIVVEDHCVRQRFWYGKSTWESPLSTGSALLRWEKPILELPSDLDIEQSQGTKIGSRPSEPIRSCLCWRD